MRRIVVVMCMLLGLAATPCGSGGGGLQVIDSECPKLPYEGEHPTYVAREVFTSERFRVVETNLCGEMKFRPGQELDPKPCFGWPAKLLSASLMGDELTMRVEVMPRQMSEHLGYRDYRCRAWTDGSGPGHDPEASWRVTLRGRVSK